MSILLVECQRKILALSQPQYHHFRSLVGANHEFKCVDRFWTLRTVTAIPVLQLENTCQW